MKKLFQPKNKLITSFCLIGLGLVFNKALNFSRLAFVFYALAWLLSGYDVVAAAGVEISHGQGMAESFLMTIATVGALILKAPFEAAMVMTLYQLGEYLEDKAVDKAENSLEGLVNIQAKEAKLYDPDSGLAFNIDPNQVQVGDYLQVLAGEKVPVDGQVVEGESGLDTSALTGEAMPVPVAAGDPVYSGSINGAGRLVIQASQPAKESTAARMVQLVQEAQANPAETESFIHRFSKIYTPIVVALALVTAFIIPLISLGHLAGEWFYRALNFLIIACPCAFVISVPVAFVAGMGAGTRLGLVIKGGRAIEELDRVQTLGMDKTGTLTQGVFSVSHIHPEKGLAAKDLVLLAARAEQASNHPIAQAFNIYLEEKGWDPPKPFPSSQELAGKGLLVEEDGEKYLVGNRQLLANHGLADHVKEDGCENLAASIVHIARLAPSPSYLGHIVLQDQVKKEAKPAIHQLRQFGLKKIAILTGDGDKSAQEVGKNLGIDQVQAGLLPQDKMAWVEKEKAQASTAFVGDGLNDAPVIAAADVGVVMGMRGSDAAIQASDMVLMNDRLDRLVDGFFLSKKTMQIVRQNIGLAIGIKVIVMGLSFFGMASMFMAVLADVGVTLLVVANGLRAFLYKGWQEKEK